MKKLFVAFLAVFLVSSHAWAGKADIDLKGLKGSVNEQFRDLSRQIGMAVAYKPVAPAEPLGILGFDIGIEATFAKIDNDSTFWQDAAPDMPSMLPIPKIHLAKGLPFGIDVGVIYSEIPESKISLLGAEVKWAILEGTMATPAVAVRGTYTKLDGIDGLDLNTKGIDISISKGLLMLTPYAGIGQVWIDSDPSGTGIAGLSKASISETKFFGGVQASLLIFKITAEVEVADIPSYTIKLSTGF